MGEVYRARDPRLGRDVAIKVLPNLTSDPDRLRRFEQEARAAAALSHPNILAVYQLGTHNCAPYLVSELLEGETLREQIRPGRISTRKAVDYGVQIARGLAAAHEKGIVHRDLKPENLFVTRDGRVKILDFGLAKLDPSLEPSEDATSTLTHSTDPGTVLGTVGYMSPEQVRGERTDHRTDMFSFGAILHEMLAGTRAFNKATFAETMTAILNEDPAADSQLTTSIPPALHRVVHRCLEKKPEARFQSASDLAFALEALSDSGVVSTGQDRPAQYSRARRLAFSAAIMIVVMAATNVFWMRPESAPIIEEAKQLTDDGEPKQGRLVTDGSRVYFNEGATGSWRIAQVSVKGGQTAAVPTQLANPQIVALAPDVSAMLAQVGGFNDPETPLWSIPLPAGEPRRIGDFMVQDATFFPDGRIAFLQPEGLFEVDPDGSRPRKIASPSPYVSGLSISPDGKSVCMTQSLDFWSRRLLQFALDPTNPGRSSMLGPELRSSSNCTWTVDGKYLLFQNVENGRSDLWALPANSSIFKRHRVPLRLTNGPLSYTDPVASPDRMHVFAIASKRRGELVRFDEKFRQFVPYLSGISATDPSFSRDGKWVAYRSYPDYSLWRSRTDGSDRTQLTFPPTIVLLPVLSPDGNYVTYGGTDRALYVISTKGGAPQKIADHCLAASWSPDSKFLAATCWAPDFDTGSAANAVFQIYDLETKNMSRVPDSQDKIGAFWIDSHALVAATVDTTKFLTFDFNSKEWSELASGVFVNWNLSVDSKYLYYTTGGTEPKAQRIRFSDRKIENIVDLRGLRRVVDSFFGTQVGAAPDGSVLLTRDIGTQEIYALTVKWP